MHIPFWSSIFIFFGYIPWVELLDHVVVQVLIFWGTSILLAIEVATIYIPTNRVLEFLSSISLTHVCRCLFNDSHSSKYEVISHGGFDLHFPNEQWMATHSSTFAWTHGQRSLVRLQSMGSWRVGHDWVTSLSLFIFTHWRRKWQPTPVFLPGESQGWGSLVGCRVWGRTESDTTKAT